MRKKRIAIPSNNPGGLACERSEHFGHCDLFTLVDIENGRITGVNTVANVEHGAGGCMAPVGMLREHGVDAIVVAGMGARPLRGFADVGIDVYFAAQQAFAMVEDAVAGMLADRLILMEPTQACQGQGNCHGH
ncbi:NifB/NifX family molybdenum-iron cluster-binding protein [Thiovibrio sp. JS02]